MAKTLKYITMKGYEDVPTFLKRIKHETGTLNYRHIDTVSVSGDAKVMHFVSNMNSERNLKIEAPSEDADKVRKGIELKKKVTKPKAKEAWHGMKDYNGK